MRTYIPARLLRRTPTCWCGEEMSEVGIGAFPEGALAALYYPFDMVWTSGTHGHKWWTYDSAPWVRSHHL
jgi:hypothetical protein